MCLIVSHDEFNHVKYKKVQKNPQYNTALLVLYRRTCNLEFDYAGHFLRVILAQGFPSVFL